jgi:hypothetical protein
MKNFSIQQVNNYNIFCYNKYIYLNKASVIINNIIYNYSKIPTLCNSILKSNKKGKLILLKIIKI